MGNGITWATVVDELREAFPELADGMASLETEWSPEMPGHHLYFEDVFSPYIDALLSRSLDHADMQRLSECFRFIDRLLLEGDPETQNLAYVALLEWRDSDWYAAARPFLGIGATEVLNRYFTEWRDLSRKC